MSSNAILNKAKYSENTDEWYTSYDTVASEVLHYVYQFKNKIVLCNCDDPLKSAFSLFFLRNFNKLELKQLICTSYVGSRILEEGKLIDNESHKLLSKYAYVMSIEKMPPSDSINDDNKLINYLRKSKCIKKLHGDGDFRSEECLEYLKISDIVVTNPPFSKFIELFSLLIKYNKKFLLIGNQNALTYKEIFPYIKNGTVWIGYHFGEMAFKVPADTVPRKYRFWIDETGQKWRSLGNAMWLTNLDTERKHQELSLNSIYEPSRYPHYDNFDAINVSKVADIPRDYSGIMGVPLTYLKYHNDTQFEIIGEANHGSDNEYDLFKPRINGKDIFKRILIRKKTDEKN